MQLTFQLAAVIWLAGLMGFFLAAGELWAAGALAVATFLAAFGVLLLEEGRVLRAYAVGRAGEGRR